MSETLAERFVSTEITSLVLTDALVAIGDRLGTPKYGMVQITPLQTLLNAATATLANKTLTLPQINDTSKDHQYVFAVSELAADRTVTLPLLTVGDEFVFKDHAVSLTNKTLTSPVLPTPHVHDTSADHQYLFSVG